MKNCKPIRMAIRKQWRGLWNRTGGLVFMVVNRYINSLETSYLEKDDLEQLGFIGLMEAAKGLNLPRGFKSLHHMPVPPFWDITRGLRVSTPLDKRYSKDGNYVTLSVLMSGYRVLMILLIWTPLTIQMLNLLLMI